MSAYLPSIDVVYIDADGLRQPIFNTDVHVYNVTTSTADSDITTDAYGMFPESNVTGTAGDIIELSLDDYSLTQQFTLGADLDSAYKDNLTTYIGDDFSTEELVATEVDIYVKEDGSDEPWLLVGSARPGTTGKFPYQSSLTKTLLVKGVPKSDSFLKTENAFSEAGAISVVVTATKGQVIPLFDRAEDDTTSGTSFETLWLDTIPAGTLSTDGDKIMWQYAGRYASNGNSGKFVLVTFDGTDIGASLDESGNGTKWSIDGWLIRDSNSVLRFSGEFTTSGSTPQIVEGEVTGLDLAANDYDMELQARSATAPGDVIGKLGFGIFIPAV